MNTTYCNPEQHAIARLAEQRQNAVYVVTGFQRVASHSTTLYCDTMADVNSLIELLFRCGFDAASWAPNQPATQSTI